MSQEFSNRRDFMIHLLLVLNKSNRPVPFGDFFMQQQPNCGIEAFRDILEEMTEKGWLVKKSEPAGDVPGLPGKVYIDLRFGISLEGVEYLSDLGLVEVQYKKPQAPNQNTSNPSFQNITGSNIIFNSAGASIHVTNTPDKLELVDKIITAIRADSSIQEQQKLNMVIAISEIKAEIRRGTVEKSLLYELSTWSNIASIGSFVQQLLISLGGS